MRIAAVVFVAVFYMSAASPAWGQQQPLVLPPTGSGCIVVPPADSGRPNTYVTPTPGGGYMIQQPGKPSTYVLPQGSGPQPFPPFTTGQPQP
jgi:hypothetical protein